LQGNVRRGFTDMPNRGIVTKQKRGRTHILPFWHNQPETRVSD
jgi:hypothetical protein